MQLLALFSSRTCACQAYYASTSARVVMCKEAI